MGIKTKIEDKIQFPNNKIIEITKKSIYIVFTPLIVYNASLKNLIIATNLYIIESGIDVGFFSILKNEKHSRVKIIASSQFNLES